jgi:hypothetical protein
MIMMKNIMCSVIAMLYLVAGAVAVIALALKLSHIQCADDLAFVSCWFSVFATLGASIISYR